MSRSVKAVKFSPDCSEAYQLYQFSQSVEIGPDTSDLPSEAEVTFESPHNSMVGKLSSLCTFPSPFSLSSFHPPLPSKSLFVNVLI